MLEHAENKITSTSVKISELDQLTSKKVYMATLSFKQLIPKIKFTVRSTPKGDLFGVEGIILDDYYQRLIKDDRTKEIASFVLSNIANKQRNENSYIGLFPSAIILSFYSSDATNKDEYEQILSNTKIDEKGVFLEGNTLILPDSQEGLVVDGQHRLAGFSLLCELAKKGEIKVGRKPMGDIYPTVSYDYIIQEIEQYKFPCIILIDFDLWEQGRVFANVNFKQKPVNRSLYYDIFGSFPDPDRNDIYLAHHYTVHLNNNKLSPLKGKIKLLGTGSGVFSQAFFVEALLDTFKKGHAFNNIVYDFAISGSLYKELPKFLRGYFNAVKKAFKDFWPGEAENTSRSYKNILLKTNGLGALIKLSELIFSNVKKDGYDLKDTSQETYEDIIYNSYFKKIKSKGRDYFAGDSYYAKGGSKGLQNELFLKLKNDIGL